MGKIETDHTGSGGGITLSSDGTSLLLDGTAIGGGGGDPDLYRDNPSSATTPVASGANAVAIGDGATASGSDSYAIGNGVTASAARTIAIGEGTNNGGQSVLIGFSTGNTVSGSQAVGIGRFVTASGTGSLAIGGSVAATSNYASAIGRNSSNGGSQAVTGAGAMALGGSYASGTDSFAAATTTNSASYGATGANSIAMGSLAKAEDSNAIALNGGRADGSASLAWSTSARARYSRSIALGYNAFSNADNAIALGSNSFSDVKGKIAFSNFTIAPTYSQGSAQSGQYTLGCQTSDATATTMTTDNSASVSSNNQVRLHDHEAVAFDILLVARQDGTDGTACAAWKVVGLINRASGAGTTTLVTSATTVINNTPNWGTPALSADTTNGNLKVQVTGAASTDIAWVATVTTSELTHA